MPQRALLGALPLLFIACGNGPSPEDVKLGESLDRIEARLQQLDDRLTALERARLSALPTANGRTREPDKPVSRIKVSVTPSQIFVNGEAVASIALRAQLEELAATSPGASVMVHADASVEHHLVVDAMDTIKKAGFTRIAIATPSGDEPARPDASSALPRRSTAETGETS